MLSGCTISLASIVRRAQAANEKVIYVRANERERKVDSYKQK